MPDLPSLRTDAVNSEQLVAVPTPATIYGATKLTGKLGGRWSIGTIQAVTAENEVQVQVAGSSRVTRSVDPTSTFNVLRLQRDVGDNASVAFMLTGTTHAEKTSTYPLVFPGQGNGFPTSNSVLCPQPEMLTQVVTKALQVPPQGRCFNDAYVGAMDWRWRAPGGDWVTGGQVASSVLERGPTRPEADGTMVRPENLGFGLKAYLNKEGGKHWIGSVNTDLESTKFDVNDLGYNQRGNQFAAGGNIEHRDLVPGGSLPRAPRANSSRGRRSTPAAC